MKKFEVWDSRAGKCVTFNKDLYVNTLEVDVDNSYIFEGDKVDITCQRADASIGHAVSYVGIVEYKDGAFGVQTPEGFICLRDAFVIKIVEKHGTIQQESKATTNEEK